MHAESGVNGVATPIGAPTWPPCVALSAGLATPVQVSLLFGVHCPVAGLQPPLHSSVGHGVVVCDCTQTPFSHPGCVQRSPSVSLQPACVLSGFLMWPAVHTPTPCPLSSQPGIVQGFGSVTDVHGWLTSGVVTHVPALGPVSGHSRVLHSSTE